MTLNVEPGSPSLDRTANTLVSVVIPTRNRLAYLQMAVHSALSQAEVALEVIIVDEASSDDTPTWIGTHPDPRVRGIRHDTPRKLPGARNAGLAVATGTYIAFLDDDDLWAPTKLRRQVDALVASGATWAYSADVVVDPDLLVIDTPRFHDADELQAVLPFRNVIPGGGSGALIHTATLRKLGGFDESFVAAEDWDCWLRLSETSAPAAVNEQLIAYRWTPNSMSTEIDRMDAAYSQIRAAHPLSGRDAARARSQHDRYLAFQLARARRRRQALARLARHAHRTPRNIVLMAWVVITGRDWPTRGFRMRASRTVAHDVAWLGPYRDGSFAASQRTGRATP